MTLKRLLILDSLFHDLEFEERAAQAKGWSVERWDGSFTSLASAEAALHVRTRIDRALLGRMPNCRVLGRFGTGLDSVDLEAAREAGVTVVNVRDYCVPEMTAHTLALAFSLERRIGSGWDNREKQDLDWHAFASERPIVGRRTATVVGFGSIGTSVARALLAIGFDVLGVTTRGVEQARRMDARVVPLEEGLTAADFVFLHCVLDATTANLIDATRLATLKRGAILINTARLGLLDQTAVAAALERGHLDGLGLDALIPTDSPLRPYLSDPRVLVTPHIGWYSEQSSTLLRTEAVVRSIDAFEALTTERPEAARTTSAGGEG